MAAGDFQPTSMTELNFRTRRNTRMEGFGPVNLTIHHACPCCGAADFMEHSVANYEAVAAEDHTCSECGRTFRTLFETGGGGTLFEVVQTAGPDQQGWLEPKFRRV